MVEYTTGDMFETSADARVNLVNCVGVMGKGVAYAFKVRYPKMFAAYRAACRRGEVQPGSVWTWRPDESYAVYGMATKDDWRRPSQYDWVDAGLFQLRLAIILDKPRVVTLPAPGCGNGGLIWEKVRPMVEHHLSGVASRVIVFEPSTGEGRA
jgi:hypothetical protein